MLPAWRGAAPVQRAIMAGDEVTGATVFSLVEELDAGPVLGTITERIRDDDTAGTLLDRLADVGPRCWSTSSTTSRTATSPRVPQPEDGVSYAAKLTTDDARVDWDRAGLRGRPADPRLHTRRPARGRCSGTSAAQDRPGHVADDSTLEPGELDVGKHEVRVGTATTDVVLGDVQPFGKKRMPAADWARGAALPGPRRCFDMTDPVRLRRVPRAARRRRARRLRQPGAARDADASTRSTGRDAAFATELVHGTVRRQGTYDAMIDHVASKGLGSIDAPVLDALRLGAHQLLSMRVPAHAAVSTTVDVVRREVGHKPVHFANALLRSIGKRDLDGWLETVTQGLDGDDAHRRPHVAPGLDRAGVPRGTRARTGDLADLLGRRQRTAPGHARGPARACAARRAARRAGPATRPTRASSSGGDPGEIPAVREGRAGVQDEGSPARRDGPRRRRVEGRDAAWLDLCAGPGGKAALLGALAAQRGAALVANEVQPHRADLVRQGVRLLPNVEVTEPDGRAGPWPDGSFDRVLVDAPCTGLGALRRRPEARWRRTADDLDDARAAAARAADPGARARPSRRRRRLRDLLAAPRRDPRGRRRGSRRDAWSR